jgi:hypothetical protein
MTYIKFTSSLYAKMTEEIEQLAMTSDNILQRAERSYFVVEHTLEELKDFIIPYDFKDSHEEIKFFKEIKPMFLKELIYYMEVFQIEAWKPPVGRADEIAHYGLGAKRVDFYLKRYNELYTYYRKGSIINDERYFLRKETAPALITPISFSDMDPRFSTVYSFHFAKMQAYEQFSNYLLQCVYRLEHPGAEQMKDSGNKSRNVWTDSKADLIELAYGIYARGSVNHGKAEIKEIITALEVIFNVNLGNFYRTFQNLRIRKKNRTPYWDAAKNDLIRTMDNADLTDF